MTNNHPDNVRTFETGATRSPNFEPDGEMKLDLLGFFSPLVTKRRAEFMNKNRIQSNGEIRDGDNWQKGMPFVESFRSLKRHILDMELIHDGREPREGNMEDHMCAAMFNIESMLLTLLEARSEVEPVINVTKSCSNCFRGKALESAVCIECFKLSNWSPRK